jgi:hypothetical protein
VFRQAGPPVSVRSAKWAVCRSSTQEGFREIHEGERVIISGVSLPLEHGFLQKRAGTMMHVINILEALFGAVS